MKNAAWKLDGCSRLVNCPTPKGASLQPAHDPLHEIVTAVGSHYVRQGELGGAFVAYPHDLSCRTDLATAR